MGQQLDKHIAKLEQQKKSLKQDPSYAQYAYVTHEDLKKINWNKAGEESLLLAIQTPHGSLLNIYSTKDMEYSHKEAEHYHLVIDAGKTPDAVNEPITVYQIETKKVLTENKRLTSNYEQPAFTPFMKEHART
jgi:hypothetical protein